MIVSKSDIIIHVLFTRSDIIIHVLFTTLDYNNICLTYHITPSSAGRSIVTIIATITSIMITADIIR